jgi:hypothetical protein
LTLWVFEAGDQRGAVDDQSTVGGVHHVGQAWYRIDQVDTVSQLQVDVAQALPLR